MPLPMLLQIPSTTHEAAPVSEMPALPCHEAIGGAWALPLVCLDDLELAQPQISRRGVLAAKKGAGRHRETVFNETRGMAPSPEKSALYKQIQALADEEKSLENFLQNDFVPQHDASQFLSPRAFFQSPLFGAVSRSAARERNVLLVLATSQGKEVIRYEGPELRQSDGRVFLTLLHMLRDVRVGTEVCIEPETVCKAIFGRYDGNSRRQLRAHIRTLQKGLIITGAFSVQLCQAFEHPKFGEWTVSLHPHIVEIFRVSPKVWLSIQLRLSLTEGLATWLYSYIECQTRLIPTGIERVRVMCGSEASLRAFTNCLRIALRELAQAGIIDSGWSVRNGSVRWMKARTTRQSTDS